MRKKERTGTSGGSPMNENTYTEFVLAAVRVVAARVRLIGAEIDCCGAALKNGAIDAATAIAWCEEVAPGCIVAAAVSLIEPDEEPT
jgi:hypothetical protein